MYISRHWIKSSVVGYNNLCLKNSQGDNYAHSTLRTGILYEAYSTIFKLGLLTLWLLWLLVIKGSCKALSMGYNFWNPASSPICIATASHDNLNHLQTLLNITWGSIKSASVRITLHFFIILFFWLEKPDQVVSGARELLLVIFGLSHVGPDEYLCPYNILLPIFRVMCGSQRS